MIRDLSTVLFLAWRSLWSHRSRNLIVGSLVFFGTVVVTAGSAVIDSMERTMAESIVESVAGHADVYAADAPDDLALYGSSMFSRADIGFIPSFQGLEDQLAGIPEVKTVVPMAIDMAQVVGGNDLDRLVASLRQALVDNDGPQMTELAGIVRDSVTELLKAYQTQRAMVKLTEDEERAIAAMTQVASDDFWRDFSTQGKERLDFIDNSVARFADQFDMPMYLWYMATNPQLFAKTFEKFEILTGDMIPSGERGLLFNRKFYDDVFQNRIIHRLEKIREGLAEGRTLAGDSKLRSLAERNAKEYIRVLMRIRPGQLNALDTALAQAPDAGAATTRGERLKSLLTMNDNNVQTKMKYFDSKIRPLMREHEVVVGDSLEIRSFTRSGYMRSARVKVHGVFRFKGVDRSDLAGSHNILDLGTFRDLYGFMTEEKRQEMESIKIASGLQSLSREEAEGALFGEAAPTSQPTATATPAAAQEISTHADPVLHAAIFFKKGTPLDQGLNALKSRLTHHKPPLKVVDWQSASGMVGQFITIIRAVLAGASLLVFLAALIIINNSMIISTMERTAEIGTLRAIGAQRRFVLTLFMSETLLLGLIAGGLGLAGASGLVSFLARWGIPAVSDQLAFLFAGERLYPTLSVTNLLLGLGSVLVVSLLAAFYPARVAARVAPIVAMQSKE